MRCVLLNIIRLEYENYRNLMHGILLPCDGINIIYGRNAQGKTNLLEAIWLFTGGKSFRGAKDSELISFNQTISELKLTYYSEEREQTAKLVVQNGRRRAELNGVPKKSASQLVGKFCAVLFSPEHLSLIKDGPALRRNFMDSALCQVKPAYASLLSHYNHTLIQRNALLKDIPRHGELLDTLEIWDDKLTRYGEQIAAERIAYLEKIRKPAQEVYQGISEEREAIQIAYVRSDSGSFREALFQARRDDLYTGHTSVGPHRDDMEITVNGLSARAFGSQGQQRSIVLALKLAEAQILEEACGEKPVILLDDVMSELDAGRQDYLLNQLTGRQVFITCCEPDTVKRLKEGALFRMTGGMLHLAPEELPAEKKPEEGET